MFCAIQKYSLSQWPFVTGHLPLQWDRRGDDGTESNNCLFPVLLMKEHAGNAPSVSAHLVVVQERAAPKKARLERQSSSLLPLGSDPGFRSEGGLADNNGLGCNNAPKIESVSEPSRK